MSTELEMKTTPEPAIDWNAVFDEEEVELETNVDIVMCLDLTGSMSPVLEKSKLLGRDLAGQINEALREKHRRIDSLRFKICGFRDYYCDDQPMVESDFFELPTQEKQFLAYLDKLHATGGGDAPESSLEALYKAFTSDWITRGAKRRHIVLLMTDTGPHPLDHPKRNLTAGYPQDMPHSLEELGAVWDDGQGRLGSTERRMAIFAPDDKIWRTMNDTWPLVHHSPCRAGEGLNDVDMKVVVNWIANSI